MQQHARIRALRFGLASPAQIRAWSSGEVTLAETINFRSQQPVPGGLLCQVIFGPTRDWSCACGKYHHQREPGIICSQCGVELAPATVRRERMGHIELATPVAHPWFLRAIGLLLDLSPRHISAILASQRWLVVALDETMHHHVEHLSIGDMLEEDVYRALCVQFPGVITAKTGGEAIYHLLRTLDLDTLASTLREHRDLNETDTKRTTRRLQIVNALRDSDQRPEWMMLTVLPVLPPELRPVLVLDGGRLASSDLNELYARVLHRNKRLRQFLDAHAPEVLLNNERRLLQEACSALLDNIHTKRKATDSRKRPFKSLTSMLQGKQGRFRRSLLGKRVDYSGRSVIVVGPSLKLHECGLPKEMACELFKPFIIAKLLDRGYARSPRAAKRMVERRDTLIWDVVEEVLYGRVILLNRAPTLHRLSMQAFFPKLVEGSAIHLPPLVCAPFNADFDGDQMAVHVPLTQQAQQEARRTMLSTHNLRHPASGEPAISPSQEMVLGCFYLTEDRPTSRDRRQSAYTDQNEAVLAYEAGHIDLHTPITVRIGKSVVYAAMPPVEPSFPSRGRIETTLGRLLFNKILPEPLGYRNYAMNKEALKALVAESLTVCGQEVTAQLLDDLKRIGFRYATKSGISFATSDIAVPSERDIHIAQGQAQVAATDARYHAGELTYAEWYREVIEIWTHVTEEISDHLKDALDPYGTLMTIVKSGATKAKFQQIRQLSGIRGLMASPSGRILPIPVLSNYLLGLTVWELFIAASGARKGFMDRSLNTAMSGYLTRRLVEAGMQAIITCRDCGTSEGILIAPTSAIGRVLSEEVAGLVAGTMLDTQLVDTVLAGGTPVRVRSPLFCQAPYGLCQYCYGADLATGTLVAPGTAVGVLAGQAIGEPGTQLTMRTFHAGGIANNASDITLGLPRIDDLFEAHTPGHPVPLAEHAGVLEHIAPATDCVHLHFRSTDETAHWVTTVAIGSRLVPTPGQVVPVGTALVEGPCDLRQLLTLVGREATQRYIIEEVQKVYRGTGAFIADKHLEVIVGRMLHHVQITHTGDSELLPGSILDRETFREACAATIAQGGTPALARPHLLGLTATILQTESPLAAASFQETSRVLARAALHRKIDTLQGLKEHLIVGSMHHVRKFRGPF